MGPLIRSSQGSGVGSSWNTQVVFTASPTVCNWWKSDSKLKRNAMGHFETKSFFFFFFWHTRELISAQDTYYKYNFSFFFFSWDIFIFSTHQRKVGRAFLDQTCFAKASSFMCWLLNIMTGFRCRHVTLPPPPNPPKWVQMAKCVANIWLLKTFLWTLSKRYVKPWFYTDCFFLSAEKQSSHQFHKHPGQILKSTLHSR